MGLKFFKIRGNAPPEKYIPKSYGQAYADLSFTPVEVANPGKSLTREEKEVAELDDLHKSKRILRTMIPMGFANAKISLTDLGIRSQIESELDEVIRRLFPDGKIRAKRNSRFDPVEILQTGIKTFGQLCTAITECEKGSTRLTKLCQTLEILNLPYSPKTKLFRITAFPLLRALNGDDNIALQPARVGEANQKHLIEKGQGIETSKTASSVKYISYCQTPGVNPLTSIVVILLKYADRGEGPEWKYTAGDEETHLVRDFPRPRLYTQAFKGSDKALVDTSDVARGLGLALQSRFLSPADKLLSAMMFQLAFPIGNPHVEAFLPEAYGGLTYPHYYAPGEDRKFLSAEHKRAIYHSTLGNPQQVSYAKTQLRRQQGLKEKRLRKDERMIEAIEFIDDVNDCLEIAGQKPVKVLTFAEAKQSITNGMGGRTLKSNYSSSEFSTPPLTFGSGQVDGESIMSESQLTEFSELSVTRYEKTAIHKEFVPITSIRNSFESSGILQDIINGNLRDVRPARPRREMSDTKQRLRIFSNLDPVTREDNPSLLSQTTEELMKASIRDRARSFFISRKDAKRIAPVFRYSLKIERGLLGGVKAPVLIRGFASSALKFVKTKTRSKKIPIFARQFQKRVDDTFIRETNTLLGEETVESLGKPSAITAALSALRRPDEESSESEYENDDSEGEEQNQIIEEETELPEDKVTKVPASLPKRRWADFSDDEDNDF